MRKNNRIKKRKKKRKKINKKYEKNLKKIFWALILVFILMLVYFLILGVADLSRIFFLYFGIIAFIFFLLGIALIILTIKARIKGKEKLFLMLMGFSAPGFLVCVILHNLFYALVMITHITILKSIIEFIHAAFFLIAIPGCPAAFIIGVIGSIILFRKKNKK